MKKVPLFAAVLFASVGPTVGAPPLTGGTLNYRNVTAARINSTVTETANNEKEVEFGDFDNDGDLDVVIANAYSDFGTRRNKLYRNDDGQFNEISGGVVISGFSVVDVSRNAFFRDYDLDGWLDIIIVNDANTGGDGGRTKIYMNNHPGGVFTHFTEEGLARLGPNTGGAACGGVSIDADHDGDFDLYVGNYPGPSQDTMYFNDALGFFTNMTGSNLPVDGDYTVDVSSADMNGDGRIDLLVTNGAGPTWIYYNHNQDAGSGLGDFSYANSTTNLGTPAFEAAMEPGDFDNDGDMDVYWTNRFGAGDRILQNDGNDAAGKAVFSSLSNLPASVLGEISRKATVADLNGDGRVDVFVMKGSGAAARPTVLRNVTVNGNIEFVDWTPQLAFPIASTHLGWQAAAFDADGDGDLDLFLGGWMGEHLFYKVPGAEYLEDDLVNGTIPGVVNARPASVLGTAGDGESDVYVILNASSGSFASVVLNGADDYRLEILDGNDTVLAAVNRGGLGIEEAVQYDPASLPVTVKLRITVLACASPYNVSGDCGVGIDDFLDLLAAWGPNPGHPADFNDDGIVSIDDFLDLLAAWGPSDYNLEVLIRSG